MQKNIFSKKKLLITTLFLLTFVALSFFAKESIGRYVSLFLLILFFYSVFFFSGSIPFAFTCFLILALPLNITYQLPFEFSNTLVNNIHVNYLVPTVSILDLGVFLFLVSSFVQDKFSFKTFFARFKIPFLVFSLFLLIQNILFKDSLVLLNSVRFLSYIVSFVILIESFKKSKLVKRQYLVLSGLLLLTVLFQGVVGFLQFKGGTSLGLQFLGESQVSAGLLGSSFVGISGKEILRAYGTFPHPNMLAGFLLISSFCAMYFLTKVEKKFQIIPLLTILSCAFFLIPTFSRVTILLFVISFLALALNKLVKKKGLYSFYPFLLLERFASLFTQGDSGVVDRKNLLKVSVTLIKENFLKGTGLGRYVLFMGNRAPLTSNGLFLLQPVHNVWILLLVEFGIFGFLSFFYFLFRIVKEYFKGFNVESGLILLSLITIGMFDHYFVSLPQGLVMFWILFGLFFLLSKKLRNNKKKID